MDDQKHYHLLGVGGIGMSGIAQLLIRRGQKVSGSDVKESQTIQRLRKLGVNIFIGHEAKNISGADVIVYSSAITEDNPEMQAARQKGLQIIKRAQALVGLMQDKQVITVTGSHGKTTTASLVSYLLLEAGLLPTIAVGGILKNIDTNASFGEGKFFVAEADESDGSFLFYKPKYSIITNIDYEHLDYYKDFNKEVEAFAAFIHHTDKEGCVFYCDDDKYLKGIMKNYHARHISFGLKDTADMYPRNIQLKGLSSEFDCVYRNKAVDRFHLALGGAHNISNCLSAIALGLELGIETKTIKKALENYKGAGRRLEIKLQDETHLIIDDYAHHPTEIKASLAAVRALSRQRVIAVFQPHRYTRTKLLLDEFGKSFDAADYVIITDIYAASEKPIAGVNAESICDKIKQHTPDKLVSFLAKDKIIPQLLGMLGPKDLVITLGAGDITKICDDLVESIKRKG